jgi:hypothetical protein
MSVHSGSRGDLAGDARPGVLEAHALLKRFSGVVAL